MAITFDGYPITSVDYEGTTLTHIADSVSGCCTTMAYAAGTVCAGTPANVNWSFVGFDYCYDFACGFRARARIRVCETGRTIGWLEWIGGAPNDFTETPNPISADATVNLGFTGDKYIYGCYSSGCAISYSFKFPAGICCTWAGYVRIPGNCGLTSFESCVGTATYCSEWTKICACDYQHLSCCSRTSGTWLYYSPYTVSVGARQICGGCCYCTVNCHATWCGARTLCNNYVIC